MRKNFWQNPVLLSTCAHCQVVYTFSKKSDTVYYKWKEKESFVINF